MLATINRASGEGLPMVAALGLYTPASDISGDGDSGVVNSERDLIPTDLALAFAHLNQRSPKPCAPGPRSMTSCGLGWPGPRITSDDAERRGVCPGRRHRRP